MTAAAGREWPRLGKVTSTSPVRVRLNGDLPGDPNDPTAEPPRGVTLTNGQEVLVENAEDRWLIVWAAV